MRVLKQDSTNNEIKDENVPVVRISEKLILNVKEASAYSGIGTNTIYRMLSNPGCPFLIYIGKNKRVKRKAFEEFIDENITID